MRIGGRLAAAIEVLDDIEKRHRPAADALKDWGLSHRFAGSGDRAAIGNIVYDALRRRRSAAWRADDDSSRGIAIGALVSEWQMPPRTLAEAIEGDRFAPAQLSEVEIAALTTRRLEDAADGVRADVPAWCEAQFEAAFGDGWVAEGEALAARPPLDLRVNTLRSDRARVMKELVRSGAAATDIAPLGLRIAPVRDGARHPNVQAEPAFQKGWFEVQDEGSQIAAALTGARAGEQVLDYCAGAGGKTLAICAAMENRGQVFAHDSDRLRLAPIIDRLKRAGCRNMQVVGAAADLDNLDARCDLVLVDAPCTGSGTWRRKPDAKWRLSDRQLAARSEEQSGILLAASRFVKPGGRLVYVTCSVFREENELRMADFLQSKEGFEPMDHAAMWDAAGLKGGGRPAIDSLGIRLSPASAGTDGFFISLLQRR